MAKAADTAVKDAPGPSQVVMSTEAAEALGKAIAGALAPGIRHGETIADVRGGQMREAEGGEFSKDDRLARRNARGEMLKYRVSFSPKQGTKFNVVSGIINDYRYALKRGVVHEVPWFVVDFWRGNIETNFFPSKDDAGNNIVVANETPSEVLGVCEPIDPLPGFVDGEHVEVTMRRWAELEGARQQAGKQKAAA